MKKSIILSALVCFLALSSCGGGSDGGTETGTTSGIDVQTVGARINSGGSALLPAVNSSDISESISEARIAGRRMAINGSSDEWDTYLAADNAYVLTDIFGSPDDDPAPVTRVRVLLGFFADNLDNLFSTDPQIDCTGGSALAEGTTIEIAFFGEVDNGTAANPFYDCLNESGNNTTLYGLDADGNLHVVEMSDTSEENTEEAETRGDTKRIMGVTQVTYGEDSDGNGFIDLQYAQASVYNGPDDAFDTDDDVLFKSRSRISGDVIYDSEGNATSGTGEFNITKYDASLSDSDDMVHTATTQTMGRGSYTDGGFSLFKVNSDVDAVADIPNTYCIESGAGLPAFAASSNCSTFETDYAWGATSFSFDLDPAIDAIFDNNSFFESDDTDLIANNGSNFSIPSY